MQTPPLPALVAALVLSTCQAVAEPFSYRMPLNEIQGRTRWRSTRRFVETVRAVEDHTARSEKLPRHLSWVDRMNLEASTRVPRWLDELPATRQAWMRFDPMAIPREALVERVILRVAYRRRDGDQERNPPRAYLTFRAWRPETLRWQGEYLAAALDDPMVIDGDRISWDITRLAREVLRSRSGDRGFSVVLGPELYPASAVEVPATARNSMTEDRLHRVRGRQRRQEREASPSSRLVLYSTEHPSRQGPELVVHYRLPVPSAAPVTE